MRSVIAITLVVACSTPREKLDRVATLHVTVGAVPDVDPRDVQFAIGWNRDPAVWPERLLEVQELVVESHNTDWPIRFELALVEPPSDDPFYAAVGYRPGRVVAYLDDNANDRLDFTPIDADAFVDRLIAYSSLNRYVYYPATGTFSFNPYGDEDLGLVYPVMLHAHSSPHESCHLLQDWVAWFAYHDTVIVDSDGPGGPWGMEAAMDPPCPGSVEPAATARVACGSESLYHFHALEKAATPSAFISATCLEVVRVCEVRRADPTAPGPWPCPCDVSPYPCVQFEQQL